jgi:hypothetical protein
MDLKPLKGARRKCRPDELFLSAARNKLCREDLIRKRSSWVCGVVTQHEFEDQRWSRIRVEVTNERLQAWIDDRQVVDVDPEGRKLSPREGAIKYCAPSGLATWLTSAELRGVRWHKRADGFGESKSWF